MIQWLTHKDSHLSLVTGVIMKSERLTKNPHNLCTEGLRLEPEQFIIVFLNYTKVWWQ